VRHGQIINAVGRSRTLTQNIWNSLACNRVQAAGRFDIADYSNEHEDCQWLGTSCAVHGCWQVSSPSH
jgi:hypothetical protein